MERNICIYYSASSIPPCNNLENQHSRRQMLGLSSTMHLPYIASTWSWHVSCEQGTPLCQHSSPHLHWDFEFAWTQYQVDNLAVTYRLSYCCKASLIGWLDLKCVFVVVRGSKHYSAIDSTMLCSLLWAAYARRHLVRHLSAWPLIYLFIH